MQFNHVLSNFSAISVFAETAIFSGTYCEFTDTNIIGVDASQGSNFSKKQTLLQPPTAQVPYNTRCKATKAKSKKIYATDNQCTLNCGP